MLLPVWSRCGSWRRSHSFSSGTWASAACGWCGHSTGAAAGAPLHQRSASIHATARKQSRTHQNCSHTTENPQGYTPAQHCTAIIPHINSTTQHTSLLPSSGSSEVGSAGQPVHSHYNNLCRSNRTGNKITTDKIKIHRFPEMYQQLK